MKKGFTLIELLIVIMVMSILIGIALPRFGGMRDEGNATKAAAELATLQTAVESYYIHQGHAYPTAGTSWEDALTNAAPQIIGSALPDPFAASGTTQYLYSVSGNYYVIGSLGPKRTGAVSINTTGAVTASGGAIFMSNGTPGSGGF